MAVADPEGGRPCRGFFSVAYLGPEYTYWDIDKPGLYEFYIAGRSHGFGIDRIAIYSEEAPINLLHRTAKTDN